MTPPFSTSIPQNSKKIKRAFVSMVLVLALCVLGYIISMIFWDDYTYPAFSLRYRTNVTAGWPASLSGWSLWLGIAIIVVLPMIYFMQDWKNPSLGITAEGLFINQQMMRNVTVPFSNIEKVEKQEHGYKVTFRDNKPVYARAGFFKPFVKSNLQSGGFAPVEELSPELDRFFEELGKRL